MFGKKTNLRKLIDSINKEDFNHYKAAFERKTKECEIVKKLYEKLVGQPLLDRIWVTMNIKDFGPDNKYKVTIEECYCKNAALIRSEFSGIKVAFDDEDIRNAIVHFGSHLHYRGYIQAKAEAVINEYISGKEFRYDVGLDNETYRKLRLLVESFN